MIIEYDFGKKGRADVGPARPCGMSEPRPPRKPGPAALSMEAARIRIFRLETALRAAKAACDAKDSGRGVKIMVDAEEYARLRRCRDVITAALEG